MPDHYCAWCRREYNASGAAIGPTWTDAQHEAFGAAGGSHGICNNCLQKQRDDIARRKAQRANNS